MGRGGTFEKRLALIVVGALALRVLYVLLAKRDEPVMGDAIFYNAAANTLADLKGFVDPFHPGRQAADHPPLTIVFLAPVSLLSGDSLLAQRLAMATVGAAGVAAIGLLGRRVAGERVGLLAAAVAAVYANLWMNDGLVMSESLATVGVAVVLLCVYRFLARPSARAAALLGLALGVTVLARAEVALLLPLVVLPAALGARELSRAERWQRLAISTLVAGAVVAPWALYNLARFEEPVVISTNDGLTLAGANCESMYYSGGIGLWDLRCALDLVPGGDERAFGDQSQVSAHYRDHAVAYLRDNLDRLPAVLAARVGRVWSVYEPGQMVWYNQGEGREAWASRLGLWQYGALLPLAVAGAVVLHRRGVAIWPLVATVVLVTLTAMAFYGLARFRVPAEVAICVLAAAALDQGWRLLERRRAAGRRADREPAVV
ncbi:MAG: glycosyltransferase family 39 protein [Acidimicrobiales bacterium]|nr:glycosyltransferase family 39 protein [Acidimicrobiales bacterium]